MLSQRFAKLTPYTPGEQPQDRSYIKLNTNENPYPPAPGVIERLRNLDPERLRRYPDPSAIKLRQSIAARYGVALENVFVGNGSDEVLSFCFFAFFESSVVFPELTYSFYPVYCDFYSIAYQTAPMAADLSIDIETLLAAGCRDGIVLANPNAPTGTYHDLSTIVGLRERMDPEAVLLVDEAYIDFGGESAAGLVTRFPNLIVVQTFSKSMSLAGGRLGYAFASPELVDALMSTKDSFNSYPVGAIVQELGTAAMEEAEYYSELSRSIVQTRENFTEGIRKLGWSVIPSMSNFVFARLPGTPGLRVYETLKEAGILVRHFASDRLTDYVRITIGTPEQMDLVTGKIRDLL